jgi:hypothetical protein
VFVEQASKREKEAVSRQLAASGSREKSWLKGVIGSE